MIERYNKNRNVLALFFMILLTCITQVLILLKSSIAASVFGISEYMDAYNFSNSIVSFIFGIVASGIPTVIIPCYVKKENRKNIDGFLTVIYGTLLIVTILIMIFRQHIIVTFSKRDAFFVTIASDLLYILLFSQYLIAISDITVAFFQCNGKYNIPKIVYLCSQIIVVLVLLLKKEFDIFQYAWIIMLGSIVNFILNLSFALKNGWRYKINIHTRNAEVRNLVNIFIPVLLSNGIYKLSLFIDSIITSRLQIGQLSILSYSNQIAGMVDTVLIGNLLIYSYPKIVLTVNKSSDQQNDFWNHTILFHSLVCLIIAGFACVGRDGIELLFQRGSFDEIATSNVFIGTLLYICGQQTNVIRDLIYRFFYAKGDTKTTACNSMLVSVINIIISIVLVQFIGLYGVILGTVLASLISLNMIINTFRKKIGVNISLKKLCWSYVKNISIMLISICVVLGTKMIFNIENIVFEIIVFGFETIIIYCCMTYFLNRHIFDILKSI